MISSLLSVEIRVHMINNGNHESRGSEVKRDVGGDEKQVIKFAWPLYGEKVVFSVTAWYVIHMLKLQYHYASFCKF